MTIYSFTREQMEDIYKDIKDSILNFIDKQILDMFSQATPDELVCFRNFMGIMHEARTSTFFEYSNERDGFIIKRDDRLDEKPAMMRQNDDR